MDVQGLPTSEFAFPGPLRDRIVAAILDGTKTTTAHLHEEHVRLDEPLEVIGTRAVVVDSDNRPVCVTELVAQRIVRLADVDDAHAVAEGEGHADAASWRAGHERFWTSPEYVAEMGEPPVDITDDTLVVCETFRVVDRP